MTFSPTDNIRALLAYAVCAVFVASLLMVGQIRTANAAMPDAASDAIAVVEAEMALAAQEASRGTGERCQAAGFCWILPARVAAGPERVALDGAPAIPGSDRSEDKWTSSPPDQPPRPSGKAPL